MRKLLLLLAMGTLLVSGQALAQVDPDDDMIGVYFDPGATIYCEQGIMPGQYGPGFLYLVITKPSAPGGVSGWECRLEIGPCMFVLDWGYQGLAINAATPPEFAVGLAAPLPAAPAVILLDMTIFVTCLDCTWIYVKPTYSPSIPGVPVYVDGDDVGHLIPLGQSTGGPDEPVAGVNCDCPPPIPTEQDTWGTLKTMYK